MAKIDLAYSLEIDEVIDAMEANEMWIEGRLFDKKRLYVLILHVMQR